MTKQEEIRERVITLCCVAKAKDLSKSPTGFEDEVNEFLADLHSQGVVIKVDGELPKDWYVRTCCRQMIKQFNEAGYVAVEPLIEVKK
ncbi:MAG: hypothetical protein V3U84_04625 [Thiotrichaceae bacterium]